MNRRLRRIRGALGVGRARGLAWLGTGLALAAVAAAAVREWRRAEEGDGARLVFDVSDYPPATAVDVAILRDALERLPSPAAWDREDDRDCANDPPGRRSLFCVVAGAMEERTGEYRHRQPALEVLRAVIRDRWADRLSGHAIMDFNNHPATTRAELESAVAEALDRARVEAAPGEPGSPRRRLDAPRALPVSY